MLRELRPHDRKNITRFTIDERGSRTGSSEEKARDPDT